VSLVLKDDVYCKYDRLGQLLCQMEQVQALLSKIAAIEDKYPLKDWHRRPDMPFIYLEGSSGLGKTQMAFNLSATGRVVHFVTAVDLSETPQSIYSCFKDRSKDFLWCVEQDLQVVEPCSVSDFIQPLSPLWTFGFINAVNMGESKIEKPLTYEEMRESLNVFADNNKESRPIWFLDEFPLLQELESPGKKRNWNHLRFMRNIFRALNLVVIVSSTNSSSVDAIYKGNESRISTDPWRWCLLCTELPRCHLLNKEICQHNFWKSILTNSRPLLSETAIEFLKQFLDTGESIFPGSLETLLDDLSSFLWEKSKKAKIRDGAETLSFLHGQVCLFLGRCSIEDSEKSSPLVDKHFGILDHSKSTDLYIKGLRLYTAKSDSEELSFQPWTGRSILPELKDDILLYLCLMGGKDRIALDNRWSDPSSKETHMPFSSALKSLLRSKELELIFSNDEKLLDYKERFGAEVIGGLIIASHARGFAGTTFKTFFPRFLYEIGIYEYLGTLPEIYFPAQLNT
jgi:hypothetical protein